DARPRLAAILAPLQPVVPRPEIEDRPVARIDRKPLADTAPPLIAAHVKRRGEDLPGVAPVLGTQDGGRLARIHSRGNVHDVGIHRIGCDALDAEVARLRNAIFQRDPGMATRTPTI